MYALYGLKLKLHFEQKKKKKEYFWRKLSLLQKLIERTYLPQIKKSPVGAGFAVEGDLIRSLGLHLLQQRLAAVN